MTPEQEAAVRYYCDDLLLAIPTVGSVCLRTGEGAGALDVLCSVTAELPQREVIDAWLIAVAPGHSGSPDDDGWPTYADEAAGVPIRVVFVSEPRIANLLRGRGRSGEVWDRQLDRLVGYQVVASRSRVMSHMLRDLAAGPQGVGDVQPSV